MTIDGTSSATGTTAAHGATTNALEQSGLNADTFLKLLVAQLKYQDPTKPTDSAAMLQQSAQYSIVGRLNDLAEQTASLALAQHTTIATSFLGRTVTAKDIDGTDVTGVVSAVRMSSIGPVLVVGEKELPYGAVTTVATAGGRSDGSTTTTA
jgi:flagellar basal-body rod modification protein FlgD